MRGGGETPVQRKSSEEMYGWGRATLLVPRTVTAHPLSKCEKQSINWVNTLWAPVLWKRSFAEGPQLSYAGARGIRVPAEGGAGRVIAAEPRPRRTWAHLSTSRTPAAEV